MKAGLQLWSLNQCLDDDIRKKLAYAAQCGYTSVEFAGFGGLSAQEMKRELQKNGLTAIGSHSGADIFRNSLESELDYLKTVGAGYMILPGVSIKTMDEVDEIAKLLNEAALVAAKYGIKVGYHNHAHEFEKIGGRYILDLLMEKTSDNMVFEIDVFWVAYAGLDPYEYVREKGVRVELIHMKQIDREKRDVMLPDGEIDFERIVAAAKFAKEFIVEQEGEVDKIEACKVNGAFVQALLCEEPV